MDWKIAGALAFGLVLGWNVYFVNRYRRGDISFGDLVTLLSVVGGAAVLSLFPSNTDLFGAYGVGLGLGFFTYYAALLAMVKSSPNFDSDWFLDGRRRNPAEGFGYGTDARPTLTPMAPDPTRFIQQPTVPPVTVNFHGNLLDEASTIRQAPQLEVLSLAIQTRHECSRHALKPGHRPARTVRSGKQATAMQLRWRIIWA